MMSTAAQKIMIVDDENDILWIIRRALEKHGFKVEAFSEPREAVESFNSDPGSYILVITDIRMPGMSGLELAENVWRLKPEMKVLFMTAYLAEEMNVKEHTIYKHNIIEKPFTIQTICNEVKLRLPATR